MSRLLRAAVALALTAQGSAALAYVRTTTVEGSPGQGTPLAWKARQVTYRVNASGFASSPGCADASAATALVVQSFATWPNAASSCTDFTYVNGGTTTITVVGADGVNAVIFRKGNCSSIVPAGDACLSSSATVGCAEKYNCFEDSNSSGDTLALTSVNYNTSTGEIVDADMELIGWDGSSPATGTPFGNGSAPNGWYLTCPVTQVVCSDYGQGSCAYIDIGNTVTHEAGHVLGLDHVCMSTYPSPYNACPSPEPVMAPTAAPGETSKRRLTQDDVNGICAIYPRSDSSGGCSIGGGGVLSLIAALAAVRQRRQRVVRP